MVEIKSNFAFLCDLAFFDERKKLSIIGIFKQIEFKNIPAQYTQFFVVSSVTIKGSGDYTKVIRFVRKKDGAEIISPMRFNITLKGEEEAEFGVLGKVQNIKFEEDGIYEIQIFINDKNIKTLQLKVIKKD